MLVPQPDHFSVQVVQDQLKNELKINSDISIFKSSGSKQSLVKQPS